MTEFYLVQTSCPESQLPIKRILESFDGYFTNVEKVPGTNELTAKSEVMENLRGQKLNLRKDKHKDLEIGAVCRLKKIPGPDMLVFKVDEEHYHCTWFLHDNNIYTAKIWKGLVEEVVEKKEEQVEVKRVTGEEMLRALYRTNHSFKIFADSGQKIQCIKMLREEYDLGLKEAKDLFESLPTYKYADPM